MSRNELSTVSSAKSTMGLIWVREPWESWISIWKLQLNLHHTLACAAPVLQVEKNSELGKKPFKPLSDKPLFVRELTSRDDSSMLHIYIYIYHRLEEITPLVTGVKSSI